MWTATLAARSLFLVFKRFLVHFICHMTYRGVAIGRASGAQVLVFQRVLLISGLLGDLECTWEAHDLLRRFKMWLGASK